MRVTAYIGIGSNLGDRKSHIARAVDELKKTEGIWFKKSSTIYETEPVSDIPQGKFLNGVLEIETELTPRSLLRRLKDIEDKLGRSGPAIRNGPRTIDLDILFFGEEVVEEEDLVVPHPRLHQRSFVLRGLRELSPEWVHPKLKKRVKDLWEAVK